MADYKKQLISDVTEALVTKLDQDDVELVSDEMVIALKDYEVTKNLNTTLAYVYTSEEQIQTSYRKYIS